MFAPNIDNDEIVKLPRLSFAGEAFVISTEEELWDKIKLFSTSSILGFDTESKPSFKKGRNNGIALVQLSDEKTALIIRVKEVGLPNELVAILENEKIVKVGAAIRDDLKGLKSIRNFNPKGFVDLQQIAGNYNIEGQSVRKLAAIVLGVRVSKSQQLSNWEAESLSFAQIDYAAIDAWVCREIYLKLNAINPIKFSK
ncbi:MAG TPA: 3'-5' exonuclease [Tenuifilaceae bacterium]|nr:3'-5' exonuclease [Tenuifilaceae bacterium]HOZ15211.1 3'-5' exonuclease [Tenuifilaceae bacterium]HPI44791.1 3'-5' exonuclease [Tenuifilaceae bacterium]HPN22206.1 3'-5' exonuclease [Tenuifilaceae bacterium]HPV55947.1 3'-5' exonuclease [Tenuifilaceae bacterium]